MEPRHAARLLVVDPATGVAPAGAEPAGISSGLRHRSVWDLQEELRPGDLLVVNDTRVLRARLEARRPSGGRVELLVLEPWQPAAGTEPTGDGSLGIRPVVPMAPGRWLCLAKPAKRLQSGERLSVEAPAQPTLQLELCGRDAETGGWIVQFPASCMDAAALEPLLIRYGAIPLPPYIHAHEAADNERYQTRYAARPGAVAAPTAGLHLSDALLAAIRARGVEIATTTLHVGLGTFRPVEREDLRGLELHSEWVEVSPELVEAIAACRARGGRVMAIGTTSVRSLEGVAALHGGELRPHTGPVNLVIQPGFRFAVVQGLLTNFHLPKSSLLLLVSALIGRERLLAIYREAVALEYRFFSYGDAMWIAPEAVLPGARPPAGQA